VSGVGGRVVKEGGGAGAAQGYQQWPPAVRRGWHCVAWIGEPGGLTSGPRP
jgi:hypothetical protein